MLFRHLSPDIPTTYRETADVFLAETGLVEKELDLWATAHTRLSILSI